MFLDPESRLYYRFYFSHNYQYIKVEQLDNEVVPKSPDGSLKPELGIKHQLEERNKWVLYQLRRLLVLEKFSWNFKEADIYRRREFPLKFLQNECAPYPCYVFQSALSKAFDSKAQIEAVIDITEFSINLKPVSLFESLVTSTNEFIRNILR